MPRFRQFTWGPAAFKKLHGVICVYKPVGLTCTSMVTRLANRLARDLNALPCYDYEREMMREQLRQGSCFDIKQPVPLTVPSTMEDLSEHRLVLGNRYVPQDIRMRWIDGLGTDSSGILVMKVGKTVETFNMIGWARYLRVYHVKGRLGFATHDHTPKGRLIERTTFHHVTQGKMDKICSSCQSGHQGAMFEYAGVQPNSQEAYEMACHGIIRPESRHTPPMLYGVKCIHFDPPDFTLEIHSINEHDQYFQEVVHDIGLKLKSTAVCTHIHRLRYGPFGLKHALLMQQWSLENIIKNLALCRKLLTPETLFTDVTVSEDPTWKIGERDTDTEDMIKMMIRQGEGSGG